MYPCLSISDSLTVVHDDSSHPASTLHPPGFGGLHGSPIDIDEPLRQLTIRLLPLQYLSLSPQLIPLPLPPSLPPQPPAQATVPIHTPVAALKAGAVSAVLSQSNTQSNSQSNPTPTSSSPASVLPLDDPPAAVEDYITPLCSFKIPVVDPYKAKVIVEACLTASALNQHLTNPHHHHHHNNNNNNNTQTTTTTDLPLTAAVGAPVKVPVKSNAAHLAAAAAAAASQAAVLPGSLLLCQPSTPSNTTCIHTYSLDHLSLDIDRHPDGGSCRH